MVFFLRVGDGGLTVWSNSLPQPEMHKSWMPVIRNECEHGALWRVVHVKQCGLHNISILTILWQSVLEEAYSVCVCVCVMSRYRDGMDGADCVRKLLCVTWVSQPYKR